MSELSPYFLERLRENDGALSRAAAKVADEAPGLRDYWSVVRLHLALIVAFTACVMLVVGIFVFTETPLYTSGSLILIEPQPPQVLDIKQLMVEANDDSDHDYYKTQYALLKSRSLAAQVIRDLGFAGQSFVQRLESAEGSPGWTLVKLQIVGKRTVV